jgi:hypothetical protein
MSSDIIIPLAHLFLVLGSKLEDCFVLGVECGASVESSVAAGSAHAHVLEKRGQCKRHRAVPLIRVVLTANTQHQHASFVCYFVIQF